MSDLTTFRDHARRMASASATPASEASLWFQLADEIDAYLAGPDEVVDLFGDVSVEPRSVDAGADSGVEGL